MPFIESREPNVSACPEPIAIVGMGCRWPGDSESPSELWEFLEAKKDGYSRFPSDRINVDAFYHPEHHRPGSFYTEGGCFLKSDVRNIDHTFFNIHPKEVASLDPAQRKFIEVVYEAFESAGVPLERLAGSKTGTFVGNFNYDHQLMQYRDAEYPQAYAVTGGGITVLSNRVNYIFDLKGPSMTLDTACSSSMYALHLACEAIYSGDCIGAIVGGSNLILTPECQVFSSALGAVSPTSRCHTFDVAADGYARADGIGALYIKKLSEAIKDRDPIRAVIRATAINANGKTGGITHPSPDGQEAVIRRAYERAGGLDPLLTSYFECHGTGTAVGDPIETEAVGRVFAEGRSAKSPLLIGSIKTNLGHSEPSSGIAGIMKAVLSLERGIIPATIGVKTLNPNLNLWDNRLRIVTENSTWPEGIPVRRASVNSFGYGGANAHTILESVESIVPGYTEKVQTEVSRKKKLPMSINGHNGYHTNGISNGVSNRTLIWQEDKQSNSNSISTGNSQAGSDDIPPSNGLVDGHVSDSSRTSSGIFANDAETAHTQDVEKIYTNGHNSSRKQSLNGISSSRSGRRTSFLLPLSSHDECTLKKNMEALDSVDFSEMLYDIVFTLSCRRSLMACRTFSVVSEMDHQYNPIQHAEDNIRKISAGTPNIGFIFTGQGAQWPQMGLALMEEYPEFLACIQELDAELDTIEQSRRWTLESLLRDSPEHSIINEAECSQPIVTAVQIGIIELLRSWNIHPQAVAGHSSGEIAASVAAGLSTKREAIVAAFLRGKAVAANSKKGSMLAVGVGALEIESYVSSYQDCVTIACHNSPKSCTLSGDVTAITELKAKFDDDKIFARELKTGGNAYHSEHMKALGKVYEDSMRAVYDQQSFKNFPRKGKDSSSFPRPAFFSSVHGTEIASGLLGPIYWRENLESPVLFSQAATQMIDKMELQIVIEIGPHSALQGPMRQIIQNLSSGSKLEYLPSLVRNENGALDMIRLAGNLFTRGAKLDLGAVNGFSTKSDPHARVVVDLPHYRWQYGKTPLILENRWTREWRLREHPRHDILGSRIPGGVKFEPAWRNVLRVQDVPWLTHHCIGKDAVMPSAGYIAMALEAITQTAEVEGSSFASIHWIRIQDMTLSQALLLSEDDAVETIFSLKPMVLNDNETWNWRYEFSLVSVQEQEESSVFSMHCRGDIEIGFEDTSHGSSRMIEKFDSLSGLQKNLNVSQWYDRFSHIGLCYGPPFQGLLQLHGIETENMTGAKIKLDPPVHTMKHESRYIIHPATLDAVLQLAMVSSHQNKVHQMRRAFMPVKIKSMTFRPQEALDESYASNAIAKGFQKGVRGLTADLAIRGASSSPLMEADGIFFIHSDQNVAIPDIGYEPYTRMVWKPQFTGLDDDTVAGLFPPIVLESDAIIPRLNALALHQLINFYLKNQETFKNGSKEPHLNRLLQWTEEKLTAARAIPDSMAAKVFDATSEWRDAEITRRAEQLNAHSSESRLMCHLYNNLEDIYAGEKTGIQVALQDNLLIDNYENGQVYREGNQRLAKIVNLLAHERPGLKILEVGAGTGSATREVLRALSGDTHWRGYSRYHFTDTTPSFLSGAETAFSKYGGMTYGTFDMERDAGLQGYEADWDLVIASNVIHATSDIQKTLQNISSVLKPGGKMILLELTQSQLSAGLVLGTFSDFWKGDEDPAFPRFDGPFLSKDMWRAVLPSAGFTGVDFHLDDYAGENRSATVICATAAGEELPIPSRNLPSPGGISLIYRGQQSPLVEATAKKYLSGGLSVHKLPVESCGSVSDLRYSRVVFLLEIEKPFFIDATEVEWKGFQYATTSATSALWISAGALIKGAEPAYAMISGVVRGLKTEMSHLRFGTLDLDDNVAGRDQDIPLLIQQYEQKVYESQSGDDVEFRQSGSTTFISRLVADVQLNEESRAKYEKRSSTESVALQELASTPIRLDIQKPGVLSTLFFCEDLDFALPLLDDEIEIKVLAAGVNNKDIAVVTGRHHSDTFSDECAGIVSKVGKDVTNLRPGDLVQCMSFAKFGNFVRDKAIFCSKVKAQDSPIEAATLPIAFSTAIYGLMDLGRLQPGESVLIQSATGAVGLAAIQIAKHCGAEIYVTVGTEAKKQILLEHNYGVREDHIFWSRERRSAADLLSATNGKGVDVILSSARGQLMHDYWDAIAPSGRFVEIGRTEVLEGGQIRLDVFKRNATFASFDLEVLSKTKPKIVAGLMNKIAELRESGSIKPLPHDTFHLSDIEKAFASFAKAVHIGKLVLTYDESNPHPITLRRSLFTTWFDSQATYLLVGCLGGLGRSFARWAVERGARSLMFLSRSGARSPEAVQFLEDLRLRNIDAQVFSGDVASQEDVERAVGSVKRPIKGVIQGALSLNDGLFESMTLEQFNATAVTRVNGTINLHKALLDQPLDFFQMWSSWTLLFGTATQSNYLASNAFMDAFARYRHSLGLPATSLSLSQVLGVGIVSYMPEYQQAMIRNGFYGNNEDEFLAYCEAGLQKLDPKHEEAFEHDPRAASHLLVGIEPAGLANVNKTYPLEDMTWAPDPRFTQLLHATDLAMASDEAGGDGAVNDNEAMSVDEQVRLKISRLLYVPADEIAMDKPINTYGLDSMVAAELRNWLYAKFAKDVTLLNLLSAGMTVQKLTEQVIA